MITTHDFFTEPVDYENCQSSFLLVGVTAERVIGALNVINPDMEVLGGIENGGNVSFMGQDIPVETIYELTRILGTTGFADNVAEDFRFICAKNGEDNYATTARWEPNGYYLEQDDPDGWTCLFVIKDDESGVEFHTGTGPVSKAKANSIAAFVALHSESGTDEIDYHEIVLDNARAELSAYEAGLMKLPMPQIREKAEEYGSMVECLNTLTDADNIAENYADYGGYDLSKMTQEDWKMLSETEHVLADMARDSFWCKEQYYAGMYDVMKSMCVRG